MRRVMKADRRSYTLDLRIGVLQQMRRRGDAHEVEVATERPARTVLKPAGEVVRRHAQTIREGAHPEAGAVSAGRVDNGSSAFVAPWALAVRTRKCAPHDIQKRHG